jgi:hypothetical protein
LVFLINAEKGAFKNYGKLSTAFVRAGWNNPGLVTNTNAV